MFLELLLAVTAWNFLLFNMLSSLEKNINQLHERIEVLIEEKEELFEEQKINK